ncbi:MAG: ferredoxin [Patescibacteria group bacterium]|nr:ferredoxin [Patescibacteria group bacterium]
MPYDIYVDRELCIGAATCFAVAPKTFKIDEENKAVVTESGHEDDQTILEAAQSCPVSAIILKLKESGKQVYP